MSDQEISIALALAIGYPSSHVRRAPDAQRVVEVNRPDIYGDSWYRFEYTEADVIWPIAKHFNRFPYALRDIKTKRLNGRWNVLVGGGEWTEDSAEKAVAFAVISAAALAGDTGAES